MSKHFVALIAGLAATFAAIPDSKATLVTFNFQGTISPGDSTDLLGCLVGGNDFTGTLTFESTTPDQDTNPIDVNPNHGLYPQSGPNRMTVVFSSCSFTFSTLDIHIDEGLPAPDGYRVETAFQVQPNLSSATANLNLFDEAGTVFSDDSLPVSPPALSFFAGDANDANEFFIDGDFSEEPFHLQGQLTQFVPEPATLIFLAPALAIVLGKKRRRQG